MNSQRLMNITQTRFEVNPSSESCNYELDRGRIGEVPLPKVVLCPIHYTSEVFPVQGYPKLFTYQYHAVYVVRRAEPHAACVHCKK